MNEKTMQITLPDYNAPSELAAALSEHGFGMQKKFGQNFLINGAIRQALVDALGLSPAETVWEVGPGLGAMTSLLLEQKALLTAFEIDRGFIRLLKSYFGAYGTFTLIEGDVLKTWKAEYEKNAPTAFFGNLPYNIAAKLIAATIEESCLFERMVVTVQKEVALRMTARHGSADYSSFSVLCQWAYAIQPIRDIAPAAFWPKPAVYSRALLCKKNDPPLPVKNKALFFRLVRSLFGARRKTVKNNLSAFLAASGKKTLSAEMLLKTAQLDPHTRAETLEVYDFIRLSDILADSNE